IAISSRFSRSRQPGKTGRMRHRRDSRTSDSFLDVGCASVSSQGRIVIMPVDGAPPVGSPDDRDGEPDDRDSEQAFVGQMRCELMEPNANPWDEYAAEYGQFIARREQADLERD